MISSKLIPTRRTSSEDENREDQRITVTILSQIKVIGSMTKAYSDIHATLGIGMTPIRTILHTHLGVK